MEEQEEEREKMTKGTTIEKTLLLKEEQQPLSMEEIKVKRCWL